jgi:hypothetical protein
VRKAGAEREVVITPMSRSSASTIADYFRSRAQTAERRGLEALRSSFRSPMGWLGVSLECEGCSLSRMSASFRTPPAVAMVDVESPAARAGLRRGDTITAIDGVELVSREGGRAFATIEPAQRMALTVRRDGRERRVAVTAIMRPDAAREEVAAYNEDRHWRDSSEARYRQLVTAHSARVTEEFRQLERELREVEANRLSVEDARRRVARMDSLLRALRTAERERGRSLPAVWAVPTGRAPKAFVGVPGQPVPPVAAVAPMPPTPPTPGMPVYVDAVAPRPGARYPLRYSGRLGEVNIEARAPGGVNATTFGDSLVVINVASSEIRIWLRGSAGRR